MKKLLMLTLALMLTLVGLTATAPAAFACSAVDTSCPHALYDMFGNAYPAPVPDPGIWSHDQSDGREKPHVLVWLDVSGFQTHANWRNRALDAIAEVRGMTTADNDYQIAWAGNEVNPFSPTGDNYSGYVSGVGDEATPGDCNSVTNPGYSIINIIIMRNTSDSQSVPADSCLSDVYPTLPAPAGDGYIDFAVTWINDTASRPAGAWNTGTTSDFSKYDLQGTITHELMHDVGFWGHYGDEDWPTDNLKCSYGAGFGDELGHINDSTDATMCTSGTNQGSFYARTLEHDDIAEYKEAHGI